MNKYYIYVISSERIIGPYGFKTAVIEKTWLDSCGEKTEILKKVVDVFGKEVK